MKPTNMDFMNDLARDCFNYIISDENFLPNVKKVFGIESTVVSANGQLKTDSGARKICPISRVKPVPRQSRTSGHTAWKSGI